MKKILVVDDSRIMRNMVKNSMKAVSIDCTFYEASNGNQALELLAQNNIHLVLLDWNMPELSGLDFLKRVRSLEKYKSLPIIMITSESARYNVVEALKNGVTAYIIKPLSEKTFAEHMAKITF